MRAMADKTFPSHRFEPEKESQPQMEKLAKALPW